jgi:crossover junction endodeoxyribonuclease RuvC
MGVLLVAIDPGVTGAVCSLDAETNEVRFFDTPTLNVKVGKKFKNVLDAYQMVEILKTVSEGREVFVTIEKVQAMPGGGERTMGATSAFSFGEGYGIWQGIIAALGLPHQKIHPATWKAKVLAGMGKEKDASRQRAMQLYPRAAKDLNLKKHHGRADALMLCRYAWITYGGRPAIEQKETSEALLFQ